MQQDGKPPGAIEPRRPFARQRFDQTTMLRDGKDMRARRLAVPARHPRQAMGDVLDLDIERGLMLTEHFLQHHLLLPQGRGLPPARTRLALRMCSQ